MQVIAHFQFSVVVCLAVCPPLTSLATIALALFLPATSRSSQQAGSNRLILVAPLLPGLNTPVPNVIFVCPRSTYHACLITLAGSLRGSFRLLSGQWLPAIRLPDDAGLSRYPKIALFRFKSIKNSVLNDDSLIMQLIPR